MGGELRDVKTRFTFEQDSAGIQKFNTSVKGMKKQLVGLGALLGVTLTGKGLVELGLTAEQAEEKLRGAVSAIDGNAVKVIKDSIKEVQDEMNKLKAGAGEIITPAEGKLVAERFFSVFEDTSEESIGVFKALLRTALAESIRTGEGTEAVFAKIFDGLKSGSIEALKGLPGVTEETALKFQALTGLFSNIDFENVAQLRLNMGRVRDVLDEIKPSIEGFVAGVSDPLITFRATATEARESFLGLGATIVTSMSEPLDVIRQLFTDINNGIPLVEALGAAFKGVADIVPVPEGPAIEKGKRAASSAAFAEDVDEVVTSVTEFGGDFIDAAKRTLGIDSESALGIPAVIAAGAAPSAQSPQQGARDVNVNMRVVHSGEVSTPLDEGAVRKAVVEVVEQTARGFSPSETSGAGN